MKLLLFCCRVVGTEVGIPLVPTTPQSSKSFMHCRSGKVRWKLQSMNKPADPQWQDRQSGNGRVIFTIQPAQWKGTWHEDPKVQWVVPLDGTWFVEAQDGTRAEMGPGVAFLGEDLQTKPDAQGRKGHLSGNIGDGPVTLIVVQTDAMPTRNQPCHVK